jgi:hypothetical protein
MEVLANMLANTMIVSCIICKNEVPFDNILIAAAPPKQLCPIIAIVANPM